MRKAHFDLGLVCRTRPHSELGHQEGAELDQRGGEVELSMRSAKALIDLRIDLRGTYFHHLLCTRTYFGFC